MSEYSGAPAMGRSLPELIEGFWITQLIGTAVALGIADQLGESAATSEQIALACKCDPACVLRLLRGLQSVGVCRVKSDGRFELTEEGRILRRGVSGSISGRALFTSGIMWDLYRELRTVVQTGRALPSGRDGFNKLAEHPGLAAMQQAMVESSISVIDAAIRVHDFGQYARVLDVGGGYGGALARLLQSYAGMSGGVLDLGYLAGGASTYLADSGVGRRARFVPGDFFERVPEGYDCYLLKYIVHDWGDSEALQILRHCAAAARPSSHVILLERVLPDSVDDSAAHRAVMQIDLAMMTTGGKERTRDEYRRLLARGGLRMVAVTATASPCSVIHAMPE